MATAVNGKTYRCTPNIDAVRAIRLDFLGDAATFTMTDPKGEHLVRNGLRSWQLGDTTITGGYLHHEYEPDRMKVVAGGHWIKPNQFEMTWQFVESGFRDTVSLAFDGNTVRYDRSVNVNSGPLKRPRILAALDAGATTADALTLDTPIEIIAAYPHGKAALQRNIPGLLTHPAYASFKAMSLRAFAREADGAISDAMLAKTEADLRSR